MWQFLNGIKFLCFQSYISIEGKWIIRYYHNRNHLHEILRQINIIIFFAGFRMALA